MNSGFNLQSIAKKRPPLLPPSARARYDAVFEANVKLEAERKKSLADKASRSTSRRAVGWRGTSVDLTTVDPPTDQPPEQTPHTREPPNEEERRLSGRVVKLIWECSRLPRDTLRAIWQVVLVPGLSEDADSIRVRNECDPQKAGSLDKQSFANGMWRIDNELLAVLSIQTTPSAVSQPAMGTSSARK